MNSKVRNDQPADTDTNCLRCPIGTAIADRIVAITNDKCVVSSISEEEYMINGLIDMSGDVIPDTPIVKEGILYCILELNQSLFCIGRASMSFNASMEDATIEARIAAIVIAAIHSLIVYDKLACTCGEHDIQLANVPMNDLHYTGFLKA